MEQIFGCIIRILFQNPETGYTIASLKQAGKNELTIISGSLDTNFEGEYLRLHGEWKENPNKSFNKPLFEFSHIYLETPKNIKTIFGYLTSKTIKGIGPKLAQKIIQEFGINTLETIEKDPYVLKKIPGIGEKKCQSIIDQFIKKNFIKNIILFLQNHDISIHFAYKIYKKYGEKSLEKIQTNPFILAYEIPGISFRTADIIACKLGFPKNSNQRIEAAIEFSLQELCSSGHTCSSSKTLLETSLQILNNQTDTNFEKISKEKILSQTQKLISENKIFYNSSLDKIWLSSLFFCEKSLANNLKRIINSNSILRKFDITKALSWAQNQQNIVLSESQKLAIETTCLNKVHIITGGPGTGKSTITRILLTIFEKLSPKILLAAPTGKAAKRISEITKKRAFTIHSLLEYDFKHRSFKKNLENPLNIDVIIIDEVSMIDTILMHHLLNAIPSHAKVIFIGDVHQLPSIGPGNVLKDFIKSEIIPVTILNEIFRQAKNSQIILNAHRINSGLFPQLRSTKNKSDFYFFKKQTPELALECILSLYLEKIKQWHHLDSQSIQILSPMKKGILGTHNLNKTIQNLTNPKKDYIIKQQEKFAIGDKIMQIKNNYNKEVFNGDIGYITGINFEEKNLTIDFENKKVLYSFNETDEITLAYATSIHKYQGSESACVIIPIHTSHFMMLHRNLLYTAVTRGKKLVILVGTGKAIAIAISRNQVQKRCTGLREAIKDAFSIS